MFLKKYAPKTPVWGKPRQYSLKISSNLLYKQHILVTFAPYYAIYLPVYTNTVHHLRRFDLYWLPAFNIPHSCCGFFFWQNKGRELHLQTLPSMGRLLFTHDRDIPP
jgi:hypothetical protein